MWQRRRNNGLGSLGVTGVLVMSAALVSSCQEKRGSFSVVSYGSEGEAERYYQDFGCGSFRETGTEGTEILLESREPIESKGGRILHQILYARVFWRAVPGKTFVESSQINAHLDYQLEVAEPPAPNVVSQRPKQVICYKGSGFITFEVGRTGQAMRGVIEEAVLEPYGGATDRRLGRLMLNGTFDARRSAKPIADYQAARNGNCG